MDHLFCILIVVVKLNKTLSLEDQKLTVLRAVVKSTYSLDILTDQVTLDDIEKCVNDDMKRIIPWLQQLKWETWVIHLVTIEGVTMFAFWMFVLAWLCVLFLCPKQLWVFVASFKWVEKIFAGWWLHSPPLVCLLAHSLRCCLLAHSAWSLLTSSGANHLLPEDLILCPYSFSFSFIPFCFYGWILVSQEEQFPFSQHKGKARKWPRMI